MKICPLALRIEDADGSWRAFLIFPKGWKMVTTLGTRSNRGNLDDELSKGIDFILRNHREIDDTDELLPYRSGSAPPTVERSYAAIDGLLNGAISAEDDLRRNPAYLSYYYSNGNLNPRLPHPSLSKEDCRRSSGFQGGSSSIGRIGDRRKVGTVGESANFEHKLMSRKPSAEWVERGEDGLIGLSGVGMGTRRKSLADIVQQGLGQPTPLFGQISHPVGTNDFDDMNPVTLVESISHARHGLEAVDGLDSGLTSLELLRGHTTGSCLSHSFASSVGSSRSKIHTPHPCLAARSPSPGLPPVGIRYSGEKKSVLGMKYFNIFFPGVDEQEDISTSFSGLNITESGILDGQNSFQRPTEWGHGAHFAYFQEFPNGHDGFLHQQHMNNSDTDMLQMSSASRAMCNGLLKTNGSTADVNPLKMPSYSSGNLERSNAHPNAGFSALDSDGYSTTQLLPLLVDNNNSNTGCKEIKDFRGRSQIGNIFEMPSMDSMHPQYTQNTADYATQGTPSVTDLSLQRNYADAYLLELQKAYFAALLSQKSCHEINATGKLENSRNYHRSAFGNGMPYSGGMLASSISVRSPFSHSDGTPHFLSSIRCSNGVNGSWHPEKDAYLEHSFGSSLLEEFKNNKTRSFELSDIREHVVEFSADQYGSRFIQQKLETATIEEKNMAFKEILPHARALMTDVFGNYVIQKFFGHGSEIQRKELADHLLGHVLGLSLQMYGCRVIQKVLEVLHVDYQTQMVSELDGYIMQCVLDQNGNHVIQKSVECVPQERIQFIISSFFGQVVTLSTHPYGCRVIQRVLEHCDDAKTQQIMMKEIMQSVCTLAQDQYGNYVVQHVVEHGKSHDRSAVIAKLAGQIVCLSQQKFASNVVEKCLTFGSPAERQLLVKEILGSTDENEPLQAMMKDQFANYVVQKVIDTCDDQELGLILSRIRVHLNALRRYTYGKHVVARIEKLIISGERRMVAAISQAS